MLKTSKDFMEWLGLQVGDKVKIADDIYKLYLTDLGNYYLNCTKYDEETKMYSTKDMELIDLLDKDVEILPRPKRVGDLKCGFKKELGGIGSCATCPVRIICGHYTCRDELGAGDSLYEYLETYKTKIKEEYEGEDYNDFDQEIYDLLKARLDKEVKE